MSFWVGFEGCFLLALKKTLKTTLPHHLCCLFSFLTSEDLKNAWPIPGIFKVQISVMRIVNSRGNPVSIRRSLTWGKAYQSLVTKPDKPDTTFLTRLCCHLICEKNSLLDSIMYRVIRLNIRVGAPPLHDSSFMKFPREDEWLVSDVAHVAPKKGITFSHRKPSDLDVHSSNDFTNLIEAF